MQTHKKLTARLLSLVMSIAMITTMTSATVFAAGGDVPLGRSGVGVSGITVGGADATEGYETADAATLQKAFEDIADNGTIKLGADIDNLDGGVAVDLNATPKTVTLDTNVFAVNADVTSDVVPLSLKGINLILMNEASFTLTSQQQTLICDSLHVKSGAYSISSNKNSAVTLNQGDLVVVGDSSSLSISSGNAPKGFAGILMKDGDIIVNSGMLIVYGPVTILSEKGDITVNGGTLVANAILDSAILLSNGNLTCNGGNTIAQVRPIEPLPSPVPAIIATEIQMDENLMAKYKIADDQPYVDGAVVASVPASASEYAGKQIFLTKTPEAGESFSECYVVSIYITAKPPITAITVTINDNEYTGSTLQEAVGKMEGGAADVTTLKVTAGEVTEADWKYLKELTAMTTFEINSAVTVADMPVTGVGSLFPISIVDVTVPQAITIGSGAFTGCTALTSASFPKVTKIFINAFNGCSSLETASFPNVQTIAASAFKGCAKLATLKLGATLPTTVVNNAFDGCPDTRALGYVDADGNDLTGGALAAAITAYKAVAGTDGKWYGWTIVTAPPSGGDSSGGSTPSGNVIDNPVGTKTAPPAVTDAVKNAVAKGVTNASTYVTFNNYTALAPDGIKAILDSVAAATKGTKVKLNLLVNFDAGPKNQVTSRITVDPAALAKELTAKNITGTLPLGVWFDQTKDTKVQSVNTLFDKHFSNKIVSVVYDRNSTLAVNAEFCAKLNLAETFGTDKNLYFYTYDNTTNIYKRILLPNYRVDKNGYAHITAPFGGSIIISDKPLTNK